MTALSIGYVFPKGSLCQYKAVARSFAVIAYKIAANFVEIAFSVVNAVIFLPE